MICTLKTIFITIFTLLTSHLFNTSLISICAPNLAGITDQPISIRDRWLAPVAYDINTHFNQATTGFSDAHESVNGATPVTDVQEPAVAAIPAADVQKPIANYPDAHVPVATATSTGKSKFYSSLRNSRIPPFNSVRDA